MMSMKGDGKPISFIEDCAVSLDDLADYTARLTAVFEKHGTYGTWYAHASVGCLHVRPVLNLKQEIDVKKMRAIAEEAFAIVREYKGSHSGGHGDGLVRSEFHEPMFGARHARDDGAVHRLQGLQARMPDRRRHGAHEDRVPASAPQAARPLPAGAPRRLPAALRPGGVAPGAAAQSARPRAGAGLAQRDADGVERAARAAALARRALPRSAARGAGGGRARGRAAGRHLQSLVRARECARRRARAAPRRLCRARGDALGRAALMLRPHLPARRPL